MIRKIIYPHAKKQKKEKEEIKPLTYIIHKIKVKWIKDLNIRPKIVKLLIENIGGNLDIGLGSEFLDRHPKQKQ